tara:strand:+ start:360 stop:3668 length:3309 start_codon:yes stop_codon:yes gene_type:complete
MKKITSLLCVMFGFALTMHAQVVQSSLDDNSQQEIEAAKSISKAAPSVTIEALLTRLSKVSNKSGSVLNYFSTEESQRLRRYFKQQNHKASLADIIPTTGATETFPVAVGDFFYDNGGPGGTNTDGDPGNYENCSCVTTTTLDGATEIEFLDFIVFATFDWLKIYDGPDTSGTVLFDNSDGGINEGDIDLADMIASNGSALFSGTSGSLTFEHNASGVINRLGWEVEILATGGGGGGNNDPVAYAVENAAAMVGSFDPADPSVFNSIGPSAPVGANFEGAGAVDINDPETIYVIDNVGEAYSVDVASGTYTSLGNVGVVDITGLEFNPADGNLYATTTTDFYSIDIGGVSGTLIGTLGTSGAVAIALAIDGDGNAYTYDIVDDTLYSIDTATGAATSIGNIGFDAAFGQGMTWDVNTDQVYMTAFNNVLFDSELRTVDTATGATTLIGGMEPGTLTQYGWVTLPEANPEPINCDSTAYDSTAVPFDIDGADTSTADCANAPNEIPITVTEFGTIGETATFENVTIDIAHSWSSDLDISLVSPSGIEIVLAEDLGGSSSDAYNGTVFEDGGADISAATAPFNMGPYAPVGGSFNDLFDGESISGEWILKVCDDASGDSGQVLQFSMSICTPPSNDECEFAVALSCGDSINGETASDTNSGGNDAPDEFFSYTGSGDAEVVTISLCGGGTDYDSAVRVYDSCDLTNEIAFNDDSCGLQSEVSFYSDGSSTYLIMVEGFGTSSGNFSLDVTCEPALENDICEGALPIACGETITGSTDGATPDSGAPECSGVSITAPGVWYSFTDDSGLVTDYTVSLCDSDYDTKLSVYSGDCGTLVCEAGNDDACGTTGLQSEVAFQGDGDGTTYYILVHGFGGATGNYSLNVDCLPVPPPNDMIANSIDVDEIGVPYTDPDVPMPAATTEGGNPTGCNIDGANGVWYNFTPVGDGEATASIVSPAGTSVVTFFEAPDESASETDLTLVAQGTNQCLPGTSSTITTTAGQTYYVFVVNTGGRTDITIDGTLLGVEDNTIDGFSYYPNPADDALTLRAIDTIENVAIYNILGQKVVDQTIGNVTTELDISALSTGTYIMKVSVNGEIGTYKVIKR